MAQAQKRPLSESVANAKISNTVLHISARASTIQSLLSPISTATRFHGHQPANSATEAPESPLRLQLRWLLKLQQRQQWSMVSRLLKFS